MEDPTCFALVRRSGVGAELEVVEGLLAFGPHLGSGVNLRRDGDRGLLEPGAAVNVTVNGVPTRRTRVLVGGDEFCVGDLRFTFFPAGLAERALGPDANGFSRARHHVLLAAEGTPDADRDFLKTLAGLDEAIGQAETFSLLQPVSKKMEASDWTGALALLDGILKSQSGNGTAFQMKAQCLAQLAQVDEAIEAAREAGRLAGGDDALVAASQNLLQQLDEFGPRIRVSKAVESMNGEKFADALGILSSAARRYPRDAAVLFHLAYCLAKLRRPEEARANLERAATVNSDPELQKQIDGIREQIDLIANESDLKASETCLERHDYTGAIAAYDRILVSSRENPLVKFRGCQVRAHLLANSPLAASRRGDTIDGVIADLDDVARREPQLAAPVKNLIGQLRTLKMRRGG